jgi:hypothetical protein
MRQACLVFAAAAFVSATAAAQPAYPGWQFGAVIDMSAASRELALGKRPRWLGLGHSDATASGPVGDLFDAQLTASIHSDTDRRVEAGFEEAWLQTRALPAGLQVRAGRFSSQFGYLNEQHPHADDFIERPLLYRAFLGAHYFDEGVRVNWTAPTDLYLRLGAEWFRGKRLVPEAVSPSRRGVLVLSAKAGGDLGESQSWQAGLSFLRNPREAVVEEHEEGEGEEAHGEEGHAHAHGAAFSGRRMWAGELAWKWAPGGNNARQQVRVAYELARITRPNRFATAGDSHLAQYLSVAWRFAPTWELGVRHDLLRARIPHEDHFDSGRLRETALMLAWKPSHAQTLRVQYTHQRNAAGFEQAARALQLQYVLSFGAHAAHTF